MKINDLTEKLQRLGNGNSERKEGREDFYFRSAMQISWVGLILLTKGLQGEAEMGLVCSRNFHGHRKSGLGNCLDYLPCLL